MRRTVALLVLVIASLVALLSVATWYLSSYQTGNRSMVGIMGQMMGNQYANGMTAPMPSYIWATVAALLFAAIGGITGLSYYLAFPQIKTIAASSDLSPKMQSTSSNAKEDWAVLLRTSKPEERKVLEVLASHEGKYLQKFIVKESGLSRLKTHRIISRFSERGVITVVKSGNTNEVSLAPWLNQEAVQTKGSGA